MTDRHIVAMGGGGFSMDDPVLDRFVLGLVGASRSKVCFLPAATSAVPVYAVRFFQAFPATGFDTSFLDLFERDGRDLRAFLLEQDLIYVGGGNTANLLAVWRAHGLDAILREAWEAGVVLAGVSAGANCWFEGSTTDSFGPLAALPDGLGLLPGSFCPHFDSEPERRPLFHRSIAEAYCRPASPATTSPRRTSWGRSSTRSWRRGSGRAPIASTADLTARSRIRCRSAGSRRVERSAAASRLTAG